MAQVPLKPRRWSARDPEAYDGWAYRSVTALAPPAVVTLVAFPAIAIAVADLVPQRGGPGGVPR